MTGTISRYTQGQTTTLLGSACYGGVGHLWEILGRVLVEVAVFESVIYGLRLWPLLTLSLQYVSNQSRHHRDDHHCCGVHFSHRLLLPDQGEGRGSLPWPFYPLKDRHQDRPGRDQTPRPKVSLRDPSPCPFIATPTELFPASVLRTSLSLPCPPEGRTGAPWWGEAGPVWLGC